MLHGHPVHGRVARARRSTLTLSMVGVVTAERRGVARSLAAIQAIDAAPEALRGESGAPVLRARHRAAPGRAARRIGRRLVRAGTRRTNPAPPRHRRQSACLGRQPDHRLQGPGSDGPGGAAFLWAAGTGSALKMLVVPVAVGAFGYVLPNILLYNAGQKRETLMQRALPDALDLLTISVEAGLGFDAAVMRVARNTTGPLAQEFSRLLQEMQIGVGRMASMRGMAERSSLADLEVVLSRHGSGGPARHPNRPGAANSEPGDASQAATACRGEGAAGPGEDHGPACAVHPALPLHRRHRAGRTQDCRHVLAMSTHTTAGWTMQRRPLPSATNRAPHSWRVTTAVRVFALALATGQVFSAGSMGSTGVVLLAPRYRRDSLLRQ